jgi:uncharacterized protein (UPF0297 family)
MYVHLHNIWRKNYLKKEPRFYYNIVEIFNNKSEVNRMIIYNLFSSIDTRGLNKINQEITYLKDKRLIELRRRYNIFKREMT